MSAPKPVFKQSGTTDLYLLDNVGSYDTAVFQPAFLAPPNAGFGQDLAVETAWANAGGIYLFLPCIPADVGAFIPKVRAIVQEPNFAHTRFLWVADPDQLSSPWVTNKLRATPQGTSWLIVQTEVFAFADYQFSVGKGCTISGPTESNGYGFTLTPIVGSVPNILFYTPLAVYPTSSSTITLPLNSKATGCFTCEFKLSHATDGASDFEQWKIGCAYFLPASDDESDATVKTLPFPVLKQPEQTTLTLYAALDPLNPLHENRTCFSLFDPVGTIATLPPMKSHFVTATGRDVSLTPLRASGDSPDAGFVFAKRPLWIDTEAMPLYYLTPRGAFTITAATPSAMALRASASVPAERLVCGISSVEYAGLMGETGNVMRFFPGCEAYAPGTRNSANAETQPLLTNLGTTSWVYITPPLSSTNRIYYYAQPEQALLYDATNIATDAMDTTAAHLDFLEVPAAVLPLGVSNRDASTPAMFPMAPFRGIDPQDIEYCRQIEQQAISPQRRAIIQKLADENDSSAVRGAAGDGNAIGVTPQGLIVEMDDNLINWKRLVLGNVEQDADQQAADLTLSIDSRWLQLSDVTGLFRGAMQTNELFMVATEPTEFLNDCSVRYRLTRDSFAELRRLPVSERGSDAVLNTIEQKTIQAGCPIYENLNYYQSQLIAWAPDVAGYLDAWKSEGAYFELSISGWKFYLSPYQWINLNRAAHQNTIMILKFNHRILDELVNETNAWPWPDVAKIKGSLDNTRTELRGIFDAAKTAVTNAKATQTTSPYDNFVNKVILNPDWNGILFLSCVVPLDQLPPELEGVAAGIDADKFYAHHLGLNITPLSVQQQQVELSATSLFGLIDYEDTEDLLYSPGVEFDFKTLSLQILFTNSCIQSFSCRIELLICKLFGCQALLKDGAHGNNVILEGVCQTDNGQNFYTFKQAGVNQYTFEDSALETVEILSTRFAALAPESGEEARSGISRSRFTLGGNLLFMELEKFDVFSFGPAEWNTTEDGYLRFSEFAVDMSFSPDDTQQTKTFTTRAAGMAFDLTQSQFRQNALYKKFPLSLTGLVESPVTAVKEDGTPQGVSPQELGFAAIGAPVQQEALTYPWYGLTMDLDLGTLGALAGSVGLKITLLAAWCVSEPMSDKKVFIGMKFPGLSDLGVKLPIEGILSLGFRNIQFLSDDTDKGRLYMLRLRQFGIRLLGLSFPPGNNDIYLFGNPDNTSNTKLGWYAAYSDGKKEEESGTNSRRMLSGRRRRRGGTNPCQEG